VIRNEFSASYGTGETPVLPPLVQALAASDITSASAAQGNADFFPLYAGQGCGAVRDLPSAADLVTRIVAEATATLGTLGRLSR
jgi:NAD(P)H-dependent flavin oxidoreductase YrpB (nitropropane dioxygenase family)